MPVGKPEFINNPEPRCPVILLLDNSYSMEGDPLDELNKGLGTFKQSVEQDALASLRVELSIISFGPVNVVQDFVTIDQFVPPVLEAEGDTPMGEAIEYAFDLLRDRKENYKNNGILYYRPWIFLITDGAPTDSWQNAAQLVRNGETSQEVCFFAVGVEGADMNTLSQIASPQRPPLSLNGLDFQSMFLWLSQSLTQVSHSQAGTTQTLSLPPVGWASVST